LQARVSQTEKLTSDFEQLRRQLEEEQTSTRVISALVKSSREDAIREANKNEELANMVQRQRRALEKKDQELRTKEFELAEKEKEVNGYSLLHNCFAQFSQIQRRIYKTKLKAMSKSAKTSSKRPAQDADDSLLVEPPIIVGHKPHVSYSNMLTLDPRPKLLLAMPGNVHELRVFTETEASICRCGHTVLLNCVNAR
jgi:hypothetical protein